MRSNDLFRAVARRLESKELLPDILDYNLAASDYVDVNSNNILYPFFSLDYGGSEGIYLDAFIKLLDNSVIRIGVFKTLNSDDESMRIMGRLIGDFMIEYNNFYYGDFL